jgi:AraC family transcriptional regulator
VAERLLADQVGILLFIACAIVILKKGHQVMAIASGRRAAMNCDISRETTSQQMEQFLVGRSVLTSVGLDWGPLTVRCRLEPSGRRHVWIPGTPDPWLVVTTEGAPRKIEVRRKSGWESAMSGPGDLAITSPGTSTEVRWDSPENGPIETTHVCIDAALFYSIGGEAANCDPHRIEILDGFSHKDPLVEQVVRALAEELKYPQTSSRLLADSAARFLTVHLLRHYCAIRIREIPAKHALSPRKLQAVRDYVEANISGALSLDDLASVAHISSFHFARLFKSATGETPHGFVTRIRMNRATALLRNTDWPASNIAKQVGFSSKSHFSAAFRRCLGLSPAGFRNAYR